MKYCCYYSEIDLQGRKMDLRSLSREDSLFYVVDADNVSDAMNKFSIEYPLLRMIGIRKYRDFQQTDLGTNCSMVKKLYKLK